MWWALLFAVAVLMRKCVIHPSLDKKSHKFEVRNSDGDGCMKEHGVRGPYMGEVIIRG